MSYCKEIQILIRYVKIEFTSKKIKYKLIETNRNCFFASEMERDTLNVYYNPKEIIKLFEDIKISEKIINQTSKYFANHENQHWVKNFRIFDSERFKEFSIEERKYMANDYYNKSYFYYKQLRYIFVDFLVDSSLNKNLKVKTDLFFNYNLNKLKEGIYNLEIESYRDCVKENQEFYLKHLRTNKILQQILDAFLRLYNYNEIEQLKQTFKHSGLKSLYSTYLYIPNTLDKISKEKFNIIKLKKKFIEIKIYLENRDYINILFST